MPLDHYEAVELLLLTVEEHQLRSTGTAGEPDKSLLDLTIPKRVATLEDRRRKERGYM